MRRISSLPERSCAAGLPACARQGFLELGRLELEDFGLPGVGLDLVFDSHVLFVELLALQVKLAGLDFEQLGLLSGQILRVVDLLLEIIDVLVGRGAGDVAPKDRVPS